MIWRRMTALLFIERKRGQVQLHETLLVLFIVVLLIFMGVFLVYKYSLTSLQQQAATLSEQEATVLLATLPTLPELSCQDTVCIDTAKILPFQDLLRSKQLSYAQLLGSKTITIGQLYPAVAASAECTTVHYQQVSYPDNCNHWIVYANKPKSFTSNPVISTIVSLYFPEIDEYRIGRMRIEVYL